MRIKRALTFLLTIIIILSISVTAFAAYEHGDVKAAYVVDHTTGEVLYAYNEDTALPPASTTKMLTSLLVLEAVERGDISLDDIVTVTEETIATIPYDASRMDIPLEPEEEMTLMDLLYANMISSDCLASNVLGAYVSGSVDEFVELMNSRAVELGCINTNFANPSGYPDDSMFTTARSLYLIADECMKHELFREIVSTREVTIPETNINSERTLYNSNRLLHSPEEAYTNPYYYEYAIGIKTGYSSSSGYCLVSASVHNGHEIFTVVLGGEELINSDESYTYTQYVETINIYEYFYDLFEKEEHLQSMYSERSKTLAAASENAHTTLQGVFEENERIIQEFEEKAEIEEYRRSVILFAGCALFVLIIIVLAVAKSRRKKKRKKLARR